VGQVEKVRGDTAVTGRYLTRRSTQKSDGFVTMFRQMLKIKRDDNVIFSLPRFRENVTIMSRKRLFFSDYLDVHRDRCQESRVSMKRKISSVRTRLRSGQKVTGSSCISDWNALQKAGNKLIASSLKFAIGPSRTTGIMHLTRKVRFCSLNNVSAGQLSLWNLQGEFAGVMNVHFCDGTALNGI
jgi:hypothetical protein